MPASSELHSRRELLRLGLGSSLLLTAGGLLGGCREQTPAATFHTLRRGDLPLLEALLPVLLAHAGPLPEDARQALLKQLDDALAHLSPALLEQLRELFDLLTLPLSRGPLTGVWGGWASASPAQLEAFLVRWRDSRFELLRQGHAVLVQLPLMAWYGAGAGWAHCGYPGPPAV